MKRSKLLSIPHFKSLEEFQEFWDSHDLSDYWTRLKEISFDVDIKSRKNLVAVEPRLLAKVRSQAKAKGVSPECLVNIWLSEKVLKSAR